MLFVQLDSASPLPSWLPDTHIRFSWEAYGPEQLIGAVKFRVQESGGSIKPLDALARAKHVQREADYLAERTRLFRDRAWIEGTLYASVQDAADRASELVLTGGSKLDPPIRAKADKLRCVMTDGRVSLAAVWQQSIFNTVDTDAALVIREFVGPVLLPGERGYYFSEPRQVREQKLAPELSQAGELRWVPTGKSTMLSSEEVANQIAIAFLDLVARINRGELRPIDRW